MAGKKGRSGGARKGTGGARPGAGRKPKIVVLVPELPKAPAVDAEPESIRFFRHVIAMTEVDVRIRLDAAKALAPFEAQKTGEVGKKDSKKSAAAKVAAGKFAPAAPPRLVVNNK